jgi:adenylate kinase
MGPTGAGKTPLGGLWQLRGLAGRRCHHFDFGERLRRAAGGGARLDPAEAETVRRVIITGALLEDAEFPIALKILSDFLAERAVGEADILILNGLPRHAGQAAAMSERIDVRAVVRLTAEPAVIRARIGGDAGGDRAGRRDDDPAAIAARLAIYEARTKPIENFYARDGVPILALEVGPIMTAEEMDASARPRLEAILA